ncbi:MAG: adenylosuccinate lyase [Kiritimatiellia bacterium]
MIMDPLFAISPIDGRYTEAASALMPVFSEAGLMKMRVQAEIEWLIALCQEPGIKAAAPLQAQEQTALRGISEHFSPEDAKRIKQIEQTTRHDVKAIEYFLQEKVKSLELARLTGFIHFACTSEDINNIAHALQCREGLKILRHAQNTLIDKLIELARAHANVPMLARTHGQPASPVTLGKEFAVFADRLRRRAQRLDAIRLTGKMNGAVGCFNAHYSAYPEVDWIAVAKHVIEDQLQLEQNLFTTQIEPHDTLASIFYELALWNNILLDFNRDIWLYISMGVFRQKTVAGEIGSSTMPHKVNPIDFENSEGNIGIANALFEHMASKLPISRLQRDLSDSTVLRNTGSAFAYSLIAYRSALRGLDKLCLNPDVLARDLEDAWEILAEPIQTVMRTAGIANPYEQLKELTRGKTVNAETIRAFITQSALTDADKKRLLQLTPQAYTGIARKLVDML